MMILTFGSDFSSLQIFVILLNVWSGTGANKDTILALHFYLIQNTNRSKNIIIVKLYFEMSENT